MRNKTQIVDIIHEHRALIYKVAMIYAKNREEVDDIFQEVCIQIFKNIKSFKENCLLSTWIYRIAINTSISWIRKEKKFNNKVAIEIADNYSEKSPFYIEDEKHEAIAELYRAIEHLSAVDKTLTLLYLDEVPYQEIANILGISIVNARVKMNRIKKKLKNILENDR